MDRHDRGDVFADLGSGGRLVGSHSESDDFGFFLMEEGRCVFCGALVSSLVLLIVHSQRAYLCREVGVRRLRGW